MSRPRYATWSERDVTSAARDPEMTSRPEPRDLGRAAGRSLTLEVGR